MNVVLLDTGPLSMVTHPHANERTRAATEWLRDLLSRGSDVRIPEIADYELRRELLRAKKTKSLERLDALEARLAYEALTTPVMRRAAEIWAEARNRGQPTAADDALDGDVILAAQAKILEEGGIQVTIATTNVGHLARFANAMLWDQVRPN